MRIMRKLAIITVILLSAEYLNAQGVQTQESFFTNVLAEINFYGARRPSTGYGMSIGYGGRTALGLQLIYAMPMDGEDITVLEFTGFLRFSIPAGNPGQGPFIQFNGGAAVVSTTSEVKIPASTGTLSSGLTVGWRILFGNHFFIEPYIKGGYPFYGGAGLSTGVRF